MNQEDENDVILENINVGQNWFRKQQDNRKRKYIGLVRRRGGLDRTVPGRSGKSQHGLMWTQYI